MYNDGRIRDILYSLADIPLGMEFADELREDITLPLMDGDCPEDVLAKGVNSPVSSSLSGLKADLFLSAGTLLPCPPSKFRHVDEESAGEESDDQDDEMLLLSVSSDSPEQLASAAVSVREPFNALGSPTR